MCEYYKLDSTLYERFHLGHLDKMGLDSSHMMSVVFRAASNLFFLVVFLVVACKTCFKNGGRTKWPGFFDAGLNFFFFFLILKHLLMKLS